MLLVYGLISSAVGSPCLKQMLWCECGLFLNQTLYAEPGLQYGDFGDRMFKSGA